MSQPDGGQPPPLLPAASPHGAGSEAPQSPEVDMAEQHVLGSVIAQTSAASLSRFDLPLAPVVVPPVGSPRGTASSPFDCPVGEPGEAADRANAASSRSPRAPSLSALRTQSSRLFSAAAIHRAGTEVSSGLLDTCQAVRLPHPPPVTGRTPTLRGCFAAAHCFVWWLPFPHRACTCSLMPPAAPPACWVLSLLDFPGLDLWPGGLRPAGAGQAGRRPCATAG